MWQSVSLYIHILLLESHKIYLCMSVSGAHIWKLLFINIALYDNITTWRMSNEWYIWCYGTVDCTSKIHTFLFAFLHLRFFFMNTRLNALLPKMYPIILWEAANVVYKTVCAPGTWKIPGSPTVGFCLTLVDRKWAKVKGPMFFSLQKGCLVI